MKFFPMNSTRLLGVLSCFCISLLTGCSNRSSQIDLAPHFILPSPRVPHPQDPIALTSQDKRSSPVLGRLNDNGRLITFTSSRDLGLLMQEMVEKQLHARGYQLQSNSQQQLQVILNQASTDLAEGSLRHQIDVTLKVTLVMKKGGQQQTKTFNQRYQVQGGLGISNEDISNAVTTSLEKLSQAMAQDNSIDQFFH